MTLVRVIKDWDFPDLMRQTPGHSGEWQGVRFTLDPVTTCDYVIVLNRVPKTTTVHCARSCIWQITQEPPVPHYRWLRQGFGSFHRVYTPDASLHGNKYTHSQPALPWHVGRDYDSLKVEPPPEKTRTLSWITSSKASTPGTRQRTQFLERIRPQIDFDLWGRGFTSIDDKWDGLAPYRYALAVENHRSHDYWTEKVADCLLAWAMPIYYGCPNITDYLPAEALIQIDITQPDEAVAIIQEAIRSELWRRRQDAVAHARELILDKYQFFPFVTEQTRQTQPGPTQTITLPGLPYLYGKTRWQLWKRQLRQRAEQIKRLIR